MIHYRLLKSELTGDVYPIQVMSKAFKKEDLKKEITEKFGSIGAAIVDEVMRVISRRLADGNTVSIDNFGTFSLRLGINKVGVKDFDAVRSQDIRLNGVRFNAAKALRALTGDQSVHILKGNKANRTKTADDRWVLLYTYIIDNHIHRSIPFDELTITVADYRYITGCTDYTARKELSAFCNEGKLRVVPARRYKIYVLAKALSAEQDNVL